MADTRYSTAAVGGAGPYYELRLYEMVQARMQGLTESMGGDVPPLFKRHGLPVPLALWESFGGPFAPMYGYLLQWDNLDERMRCWGDFYSDPDFITALATNYGGEQRLERANISFLCASPIWKMFRSQGGALIDGVYEIRLYDCSARLLGDCRQAIESDLRSTQSDQGRVLGVFETILGAKAPQIVAFIAHDEQVWPGPDHQFTDISAQATAREVPPCDSFVVKPTRYGLARENFAEHSA